MSTLAAAAKGDAAPLSTTPALKSGSGGANAAAGAATTTTTTGTGTATGTAATTKDSEVPLAGSAAPAAPALAAGPVTDMGAFGQISSPHELTDWVDGVLDQLEARFASMSSQVDLRMKEMSERIDALETSIEDLITGATAPVPAQHTGSGGTQGPQDE